MSGGQTRKSKIADDEGKEGRISGSSMNPKNRDCLLYGTFAPLAGVIRGKGWGALEQDLDAMEQQRKNRMKKTTKNTLVLL